jgi:hypothetical protein
MGEQGEQRIAYCVSPGAWGNGGVWAGERGFENGEKTNKIAGDKLRPNSNRGLEELHGNTYRGL